MKSHGGECKKRHDCSSKCENGQRSSNSVDGPESVWELAQGFIHRYTVFGNFREEDLITGDGDFRILDEFSQMISD